MRPEVIAVPISRARRPPNVSLESAGFFGTSGVGDTEAAAFAEEAFFAGAAAGEGVGDWARAALAQSTARRARGRGVIGISKKEGNPTAPAPGWPGVGEAG